MRNPANVVYASRIRRNKNVVWGYVLNKRLGLHHAHRRVWDAALKKSEILFGSRLKRSGKSFGFAGFLDSHKSFAFGKLALFLEMRPANLKEPGTELDGVGSSVPKLAGYPKALPVVPNNSVSKPSVSLRLFSAFVWRSNELWVSSND